MHYVHEWKLDCSEWAAKPLSLKGTLAFIWYKLRTKQHSEEITLNNLLNNDTLHSRHLLHLILDHFNSPLCLCLYILYCDWSENCVIGEQISSITYNWIKKLLCCTSFLRSLYSTYRKMYSSKKKKKKQYQKWSDLEEVCIFSVLLPICIMHGIPFSASVYAALMKNQLFTIRSKSQKLVYVDCMSVTTCWSCLSASIKRQKLK